MEQMKNPLYCTRLFIQRLKSYLAGESWLPDYVNARAHILIREGGEEKYDPEIVNRYAGMNRERLSERVELLNNFLMIARHKAAPFLLFPVSVDQEQAKDWYAVGVDLVAYALVFPWEECESFDVESKVVRQSDLAFKRSSEEVAYELRAIAENSRFFEPPFVAALVLCLETWLDTGMVQPNWPHAELSSSKSQRKLIKTHEALAMCGLKQCQRQTLYNRIKKLGLDKCPEDSFQYLDVIEVVAKTFVTV